MTASESSNVRRRTAVKILIVEAIICVVGFIISLRAYLLVKNNSAGSFWAHLVLCSACIILAIGIKLHQKGIHWLTCGIIFNGIGAILAFVATIVDGVQAGYISSIEFHQCVYSAEPGTALCEIPTPGENIYVHCPLNYNANTCYCCDIFREHNCNGFSFSISSSPDRFNEVSSCKEVESEFQMLLWTSMGLNLLNFALAVIVCAAVGMYKSMLVSISPWNDANPTEPIYRTQVMPSSGPVVLFTQHQSVGYFPNGPPPTLLMPPSYSSVINLSQTITQPGARMTSSPSNPSFHDSLPPPYSP